MPKASHNVVTSNCAIRLICEDKKAPYLLVIATTPAGETTFAMRDTKMLRKLATDILEELPAPKTSKKRAKH